MNEVYTYFGLDSTITSIYKYSPVFKIKQGGRDTIVKKTKKDRSKVERLFTWTEQLEDSGIGVVRPILFKDQLYHEVNDQNWVVYPFINGRKYDASLKDIYDAGSMLGKIHAVSSNKSVFDHGFNWEQYDEGFINDVKSDINHLLDQYKDNVHIQAFKQLSKEIKRLLENSFENLKDITIPYVDASWDYKANNLIYSEEGLVLIDPDNAGSIPRIFDLALALILFHTEIDTAPERMFTVEEWEEFKSGYLCHVSLTETEKEVWNELLIFVYMDEALWAMNDLDESESEHQKSFIKSLLGFEPTKYTL
ncbi:phosphotransferase [Bacillus spongiae]|uniref:Phosphotransferase n=1 Tax=Bacillus spongiae TaxID=2683610 RepID=A0ABU8HJL0_9BACI